MIEFERKLVEKWKVIRWRKKIIDWMNKIIDYFVSCDRISKCVQIIDYLLKIIDYLTLEKIPFHTDNRLSYVWSCQSSLVDKIINLIIT